MHKYEARITSYETGETFMFWEQMRHHLDKQVINNLMNNADTFTSGDNPTILVIIWRDGDPVLFGTLRSWINGSTVYAYRTVSRWENRSRIEWDRLYTLAE